MNEQSLDFRRAAEAIRRRLPWVLLLLLIGVGCGQFATTQPSAYSATAAVLLPPSTLDAQGRPARHVATEAQIAGSTEILSRAGQSLGLGLTPGQLRRRVRVRAATDEVIQVRAKGASGQAASALADEVAKQYVAYANGVGMSDSNSTISVLQDEAKVLKERISQTDSDIASSTARLGGVDPRSPEALRQLALIDLMRSAQIDSARQLSTIGTRIADARLEAALNGRGTRLLQGAITAPNRSLRRKVTALGAGAVVGFVTGILTVLLFDGRDRRLRRRAEIAEGAAAPVLASLAVPTRVRVRQCRKLLEQWEPNSIEGLALRGALRLLRPRAAEHQSGILLVAMPGDAAGHMIALKLAAFAATSGVRTRLVFPTHDVHLDGLRRACGIGASEAQSVRANLTVTGATPGPGGNDSSFADQFLVALAVADQGALALPPVYSSMVAALAISSGFADAESIATAAIACADAGHPLRGVFVANPDPSDRTSGGLVLPVLASDDPKTSGNGKRAASSQPNAPSRTAKSFNDGKAPEVAPVRRSPARVAGTGSPSTAANVAGGRSAGDPSSGAEPVPGATTVTVTNPSPAKNPGHARARVEIPTHHPAEGESG